MSIEHISDTARWVALYRAMESERPDAHFRDPFARVLAGAKGEDILEAIPKARTMGWPMVVRTVLFDELLRERIAQGADTVVNLAAGLDARPWRMDLPQSLRWVDVDLEGILRHKTEAMAHHPPRCGYRAVHADLTDADTRSRVLAEAVDGARHAVVLTEGLLVYLTREQVAALAGDLAAQPAYRWWITDLGSPLLERFMVRAWGDAVSRGNAPFRFFPPEGTDFFRPLGWAEAEFRSTGDEARRLHRTMRGAWLWGFMSLLMPAKRRREMRRMSGTVLLKRADD